MLLLLDTQTTKSWRCHSSLDKRQNGKVCEVSCSPATCGSSSCPIKRRRTLASTVDISHDSREGSEDTNSTDHGLFKRILRELDQNDIGEYVDSQNEQPIVKKLCPANAGGFDTPSFCVQEQFSMTRFERSQLFIGTANTVLEGCTVLMVVSTRAVYAVSLFSKRCCLKHYYHFGYITNLRLLTKCHFWQDLHYRPMRRDYYGFDPILNMIRGSGATPGAVGPALDRASFTGTNDHSWAFIMTPRSGSTPNNPSSQHFPNQYKDL
jgi:hypothetical protein